MSESESGRVIRVIRFPSTWGLCRHVRSPRHSSAALASRGSIKLPDGRSILISWQPSLGALHTLVTSTATPNQSRPPPASAPRGVGEALRPAQPPTLPPAPRLKSERASEHASHDGPTHCSRPAHHTAPRRTATTAAPPAAPQQEATPGSSLRDKRSDLSGRPPCKSVGVPGVPDDTPPPSELGAAPPADPSQPPAPPPAP